MNRNQEIPDANLEARLPQLLGEWKKHIRVLSRVPKGARVAAADGLATLMDEVVTRNNIAAWSRLIGFAFSALQCPSKASPSDSNQTSLTTKIRQQINDYMESFILPVATPTDYDQRPAGEPPPANLSKRVAAKIADCDIKGAVRIIASDDSFAGFAEEVSMALQAKHPPAPVDLALPPPPDATTPAAQATRSR